MAPMAHPPWIFDKQNQNATPVRRRRTVTRYRRGVIREVGAGSPLPGWCETRRNVWPRPRHSPAGPAVGHGSREPVWHPALDCDRLIARVPGRRPDPRVWAHGSHSAQIRQARQIQIPIYLTHHIDKYILHRWQR